MESACDACVHGEDHPATPAGYMQAFVFDMWYN